MQHLPPIEVARRAPRVDLPRLLPAGRRTLKRCRPPSPDRASRAAPIRTIRRLQAIAHGAEADSSPVHLDVMIRDQVCNNRCTHPTAGDYCGERLNATCPLSRFHAGDRGPAGPGGGGDAREARLPGARVIRPRRHPV